MPEYRFSTEWFTLQRYGKRLTIPRESIKQLYERLLPEWWAKTGKRLILEVGVCEARSTLWLLDNLKPQGWLGVDSWNHGRIKDQPSVRQQEENFWHNMRVGAGLEVLITPRFKFHGTDCHVVKARSQDYLRADVDSDYPDQPFDLIIVDGSHTGPDTILDAVLCWRKLAVGGIMIFDDFDRRWHNARPCTHEAVLAFWQTHEHFCEKVFENRWQFWVRKKAQ